MQASTALDMPMAIEAMQARIDPGISILKSKQGIAEIVLRGVAAVSYHFGEVVYIIISITDM